MQKFDWKTLYFVLASLLGLALIVTGLVTGVNTALTTWVFPVKSYPEVRPLEPVFLQTEKEIGKLQESDELTAEQKESLAQWQEDYKRWQEQESNYDYEAENRKRSLANAIALVIAGVPVFAFHAPYVFRGEKPARKK